MADLNRAREYMDAHARLLDRRRFELILGQGDPDATLATLAGYANGDGGFGWALHPDLRSVTSQPVAAIHAFETLEEVTSATSPIADGLCDWLDSASLDDGGLPFALPLDDAVGSTPMWASADSSQSSLLITCAVCAPATPDCGPLPGRRRTPLARSGNRALPRRDRNDGGNRHGDHVQVRPAAPRRPARQGRPRRRRTRAAGRAAAGVGDDGRRGRGGGRVHAAARFLARIPTARCGRSSAPK